MPASVVERQVLPLPGAAAVTDGDLTIHGRLCLPEDGAPETVMLALHGITYTETYRNPGFEPETYNVSNAMTEAGFAVDRLGYGLSSHPPAELVTLDSQAEVAHQVISRLKGGQVGGEALANVILFGHSHGTATSWRESAIYNDADAIIGTGWDNTSRRCRWPGSSPGSTPPSSTRSSPTRACPPAT